VPVAEAGLLPARPERTPERVATPAHRPRPSPPAAPAARGVANGTPDGPADGVAGGEIGGQTGGTVGGHGDVPVPAEQVEHPPVVVSRVVPAYPSLARAQGLEGLVVLRVIIDRGGGVEPAIVVTRSLAGLDEAAVAALRRWRFDPGRDHDGQPVRVVLEVPMRFQLR
jgi:protein TonB